MKKNNTPEASFELLCSHFPELIQLFIAPKLDTKEFGSLLLVPCWKKIYSKEEIEKVKEYYFEEKKKTREEEVEHSVFVRHEGKKVAHGVWRRVSPSGKTLFTGAYSFGRKVGRHVWFYPGGKVEKVKKYAPKGSTKGSDLDYDETHYFSNGSLSRKKSYRDGKLEGMFMDWMIGGKIETIERYHKGKLEGSSKRWHYTGNPEKFCWHKEGKKVGLQLWFSNDMQTVDKLFHRSK